jgi:3',5'-cyclic AMP phosphodiesterase CpdA
MKMITIKLISDVHLEKMNEYPGIDAFFPVSEPDPDIICLCGDIGCPRDASFKSFLMDCAQRCKQQTLLVMGNHEAYGKTIEATVNEIQKVCSEVNACIGEHKVSFMEKSLYDCGDIRFIGTTLWSEIDTSEAWNIRSCISDFMRIQKWGIGECNEVYYRNVSWIKQQVCEAWLKGMQVVVLTHHAPLMSLGHPKHAGSELKSAFASDLSELIKEYNETIKYWFYGHDHYSTTKKIGDTTVMSNQYGYDKYDEAGYDPTLCIVI